ncbi:hypothetical protein SYJ56_22540 [Algoriphagus sp. D3-2-R+10]|uniref:hypothetical protein n=1 Tax=Algoriphagus aurantiacus TaxID=3103948 RepID=UPI002B37C277|nr:hypothetical protein [Algoriphagus sp. D3-2-R+10]MEB2778109.1 hypothetical protein [Algoriphagus sp. D3-2-R+10]
MRVLNTKDNEAEDFDYSCENVSFDFMGNGEVEIASDVEDLIYSPGLYDYELIRTPSDGALQEYELRIGASSWPCLIESDRMTLDSSPLDGAIMYFFRIN